MKIMKSMVFLLVCAPITCITYAQTAPATTNDIDSALKSEATGVGRFRSGWVGSIGTALGDSKGTIAKGKVRMGGMAISGGVYGLFNPIRDFSDIEAGVGMAALIPMSSTSSGSNTTSYSYGAVSATAYVGPVFRMPSGTSSFGVGALIDQPFKTLTQSEDRLLNNADVKLNTSIGLYGEYQYSKGTGKEIYYVRGQYAKSGIKSSNLGAAFNDATKIAAVIGIAAGVKY